MSLSFVLIDYWSRPELDAAVASINCYQAASEIVVVSNSEYSDDEWGQFRQALPSARCVRNPRNVGYAGGVNRGLRETTTELVAVLNPDVELLGPVDETILRCFASRPRLALCGPAVIDGEGALTPSCRRFYGPLTLASRYTPLRATQFGRRLEDRYLMRDFDHQGYRPVDWVSGGAMFVRRSAFESVGGMDERFFLYMEDMDWCRAFWSAGWEVGYEPSVRVVHRAKHAGTRRGMGGLLTLATRRMIASYVRYFLKHGPRQFRPPHPPTSVVQGAARSCAGVSTPPLRDATD